MKITATLTRFHKIEERFKAKRSELELEIKQLVSDKQVTLTKGMKQVPVNNKWETEKAVKLLNDVHDLSGVICAIRTAIGQKNAELGISDLLAELEQQKHARRVAASCIAPKEEMDVYGRRRQKTEVTVGFNSEDLTGILTQFDASTEAQETVTLPVKGLHSSFKSRFEEVVEGYNTRINYLSDQISDRNKEKLDVTIPDKYAGIAGVSV